MIDQRTIFEIHRLAHDGFSMRRIAALLGIDRQSVKKYLHNPSVQRLHFSRSSKLDPFKDEINRLLEIDSKVSAVVIRQRLDALGFDGAATYTNVTQRIRSEIVFRTRDTIFFTPAPGLDPNTRYYYRMIYETFSSTTMNAVLS